MDTDIRQTKRFIFTAIILAGVLIYPLAALFSLIWHDPAGAAESIGYTFMDKKGLSIALETVSPGVKAVAADAQNTLAVKVHVRDEYGNPVEGAQISFSAGSASGNMTYGQASNNTVTGAEFGAGGKFGDIDDGIIDGTTQGIGYFRPSSGITDANGSFLAEYIPPSSVKGRNTVVITSRLAGTDKSSSIKVDLVPVPVVLIHGYQASPDTFSGLTAYLVSAGFSPESIKYASEAGVAASAKELSKYLDRLKNELSSDGIRAERFDLIAHSMGGLVARYYTCGSEYLSKLNVRKLIFVSVPQRGSPFASIGLKLYNDQGIHDLLTGSELYTKIFPSMINGGLNPSIQTGSILGLHDEVVGAESASLTEWGIETELFDVGDSSFTFDKLFTGEILQAANHKLILYNMKVYRRIVQMLETDMPFPAIK